jgi:hypothetical protein
MRKIGFLACLAFVSSWAALAQAPAAPEERWPRELDRGGNHFVIYQPQVDSWKNNHLEARSAVMVTQTGQPKPAYGIVSLSARTEVDKQTRMVALEDLKVTGATFPAVASRQSYLSDVIRQSLPDWPRTISLDRLLADLAIAQAEISAESAQLKNEPPRIIFSSVPSVLILIDGEPVFRPVQGTPYTRVINTPALLLFDPAANRFYLDGVKWWMTATSLNGPWSVAMAPPADLEQIKASLLEGEEKDPHAHAQDLPQTPPAKVFVSTVPAELIETKGEPQYSPIPRTQLVYVTNTDRDVFMDVKGQMFYVLLSGRWFQAKTLQGLWSFVPGDRLPRDFAMIPPESPKGYVLASVPGTEQAQEAVIANQIPQTAAVKRSEAKLEVRYDGYPQFKPIPGTSMLYAVNTDTEVIQAEGRYWACRNAVWFVSEEPQGPWEVADSIPAEIYSIPPSSPLFHLRYVQVYGCNPDFVYFGYTPGYLGAFVDDGVVVYGTGFWYPGWYGNWWFGWPWTWGFGFNFSYWGGGWFWRPVGPYWWYHNPWFTHRVYHEHWNPHWHPGDRDWIHRNVNVYNRWPQNTVLTRAYREAPRVPTRPTVGVPARGDFYAGRDGQLYQHRPEGWYQQNNSGAWRRVTPSPQIEQQRQSRSLGQARRDEFQNRGQVPGIPRTVAPRMAPSRPSAPSGRRR